MSKQEWAEALKEAPSKNIGMLFPVSGSRAIFTCWRDRQLYALLLCLVKLRARSGGHGSSMQRPWSTEMGEC